MNAMHSTALRRATAPAALAGALALLVAAPAPAATPASGTVSTDAPTLAWTGNPQPPTASATCNGPSNAACDNFQLTILAPSDPFTVAIEVVPQLSDDYDIEVYGPDGALVDDSGNSPGQPESVLLINPASGTYTVSVSNYAALQAYSASATLELGGGGAGDPSAGPSFAIHVAADHLGRSAAEPSIGSNWNSGRAMYISGLETLRVDFEDCTSPARATWTDVSFDTTSITTLDPILFTDRETGRTFSSQLGPKCSLMAFSDDDGASWTPSQGCGINSGVDHQSVGGGRFHAPLTRDPEGLLYPNAVYYCSQDAAIAQCARSDDGGLTFGPAVPIYNLTECGGLHGHVKVALDGTVYVPNKGCNGEQAVVVSEDNGITWDVRRVPGTSSGTWDPSVGIAEDGTIYLGMTNGGHPFVARSEDGGLSWTNLTDVGLGAGPNGGDVQNTAFPVVVAGDGDRAAFGFLGAEEGGNGGADDPASPHVWYAYVAFTYDGGQTWTTVSIDPGDPIQRGTVYAGGFQPQGSATRNLLDFNDMTIDRDGRVLFAYADGCIGSCEKAGPNSGTDVATIARQTTGKRMYAALDATDVPASPLVEATIVDAGEPGEFVRVSWQEPFDGNSPITSYNVYRRRADQPSPGLVASVGGAERSYDDASTVPGFDYYYRVRAVNALGEGASCGEVLAVAEGESPDPETHCEASGITVATDPTGDTTVQAGGDPSLDLTRISMAEPFQADGSEKLVVTIEVDDLSVPHPSAAWRALWRSPDNVQYFVSFESCNPVAGLTCSYGTFDGTLFSSQGEPEGCEFAADGTITITVDKALVGISDGAHGGQSLAGVEGRTQVFLGAACTGLLSPGDSAGPGSYLVRTNASCSLGAPQANDDSASTTENRPVVIEVLANDASSNGALTVTSVSDPANGATANNGDGTVTYQPDPGFSGVDVFTYAVEDEAGLTDSANVTVAVEPRCPPVPEGSFSDDFEPGAEPGWQVATAVNNLPISHPWTVGVDVFASSPSNSYSSDAATLDEKDDRLIAPPQDLSATSRLRFMHRYELEAGFDGGVLEVSTDGGSTWVDVVAGGGSFVAGGYDGAIDPGFGSAIGGRDAWTGPSQFIDAMTPVEVDLGAYAGGDVLVRWRLVADPLVIGSLPGTSWWIDDVELTDTLVPGQCPTNRAPEPADDAATTEEGQAVTIDVTANDADPDGDPLTVVGATDPLHGTATVNPDSTITYQPDAGYTGEDSFDYEVCDPENACGTATVNVTVDAAPNDPPTAADDAATTAEGQPVTVPVLANDTDPEGEALSVGSFGQGANGTVTDNGDGTLTYGPDAGFSGTDGFTYEACDPHGACDGAAVTVTVTPGQGGGGGGDKASGAGSIPRPTGGGTVSFGFNAKRKAAGADGRITYDRGSGGLDLSGTVTALTVDGSMATFSGPCTYSGGTCGYRAVVEDHGEPGTNDRFALEVRSATGALVHSADSTLSSGNVQVH